MWYLFEYRFVFYVWSLVTQLFRFSESLNNFLYYSISGVLLYNGCRSHCLCSFTLAKMSFFLSCLLYWLIIISQFVRFTYDHFTIVMFSTMMTSH
ncbi:hypothetical protein RchiOBHm_Chr2g0150281 [Rosa chinensis]|uniref:Uncharacterized protein n=1 Tax=Rosa chinensis TaxID=74649 RepID=A0A2P6RZU8_ROSCH|nr:hypothetical protein RchiOBHm_Chr2g0150281 [Rosa chinensis]